jgi:protein TonB
MSGTSNARIIRIAIACSLAVHLIIASMVPPRAVFAEPPQKPLRTEIFHITPPKPTPPPPTPPPPRKMQPQHKRHHIALVRPTMKTVHLAPSRKAGLIAVIPLPLPPGTPQPEDTGDTRPVNAPTGEPSVATPTPKPACSAPDVPAKTLVTQPPIEPEDARAQGLGGTAKIRVDLDALGNVMSASVYESTGSMELDRAALDAARQSRYAPEQRDCKAVSGSYLFNVEFQ